MTALNACAHITADLRTRRGKERCTSSMPCHGLAVQGLVYDLHAWLYNWMVYDLYGYVTGIPVLSTSIHICIILVRLCNRAVYLTAIIY